MASPFLLRIVSYFAVLSGLLWCEQVSPFVAPEQRKPFRVRFHVGISVANSLLLYLLISWPTFTALTYAQRHGIGLSALLSLSGWREIVATVIFFDMWDYWMHLANHRIGLLWRFHKAHHSDMEIDVTTASRFHIGELIISGSVKCLVVLLWGPSLWGLVTFDILITAFSQFHHSNVGIPLGIQDRLERVIVTPRMHRCHHSLHRECYIANFSAIFSVWDRIFRSYHWAGNAGELERVGLVTPRGEETMRLRAFLLTPFVKG